MPETRPTPRMTLVIVTYKSRNTLSAALASARRCHEAGLAGVVFVDNNSPDGTREVLRRDAGFARVVLGEHNIGFGRGCNRGLAETTTPYVAFVNPDATLEPESVRTIVEFMDAHPECAIAGPAIHMPDETIGVCHVGGLLTPARLVGDALGLHSSLKARQEVKVGSVPFRTDWVSGAVLIGRVDALRSLGGFDPRFFLYFEETDLCRRAAAGGHEVWCIPRATAHHIGGVSAAEESGDRVKGCIAVHYYQSRMYYLRKHFGVFAAHAATLVEFLVEPLVAMARALTGRRAGGVPAFRRWRHPLWQLPRPAEEVAPL